MDSLSSLYVVDQFTQKITPDVPQQVQLLANQISSQTGQLLDQFAYYGLLVACFIAAIALLFSSLLLILHHPPVKPVQPEIRLVKFTQTNRQPKRPAESCVARANRAELRMVSARMRAGQLSN